jgi:hypothetical protein
MVSILGLHAPEEQLILEGKGRYVQKMVKWPKRADLNSDCKALKECGSPGFVLIGGLFVIKVRGMMAWPIPKGVVTARSASWAARIAIPCRLRLGARDT